MIYLRPAHPFIYPQSPKETVHPPHPHSHGPFMLAYVVCLRPALPSVLLVDRVSLGVAGMAHPFGLLV